MALPMTSNAAAIPNTPAIPSVPVSSNVPTASTVPATATAPATSNVPTSSHIPATAAKNPWLQTNEKPLPLNPSQARAIRYGLPASIFQRNDTRTTAWKPWSLHSLFLSCLASMSLGALICIEILRRRSVINDGLAFYKTSDDIPTSVFIAYNYVPTILATILGVFWSIVDHDSKRLEPYTQISNFRHRSFPLSLLFLDYAYTATWKVPYRACRNRHWTVAITSVVFLAASVFLVPMQSALFGLKPVSINSNLTVDTWPDLPALQEQSPLLTGEALNQANTIVSKHTTFSPFTTQVYAVSPLTLVEDQKGSNEIWSLLARVYWSEPTCLELPDYYTSPEPEYTTKEPPNGTVLHWRTTNVSIPMEAANSTSCRLAWHEVEIREPRNVSSSYADWKEINKPLAELEENVEAEDVYKCITFPFVASLYTIHPFHNSTNSSGFNYNATAIAAVCKSDYYTGIANVSAWGNGTIIAVEPPGNQTKLDIKSLDIDKLEDSISNDHHAAQNPPLQDPMHTFVDVNTVTLGAVIDASLADSSRIDYPTFESSVERMYQLTSALSIARLLRSETASGLLNQSYAPNATMSVRGGNYIAIAVTPAFAIASEVILGLMAVAALFIPISRLRRSSLLRSDPDSLAAMFALITKHFSGFTVLEALNFDIETMSTQELKQITAPLVCRPSKRASDLLFTISKMRIRQNRKPLKPSSEQPFYLSLSGLVISYGVLFLITAACVLLLTFAYVRHFTYLADSNSLASQALWSFTPTLAATVIGAAWTVVHRDLTVLEPWANLHSAAPAPSSLSVNYASRTSYATLFKAGKNRHIFLSFVSLVCVSTNVLNIVVGGLFYQASSVITVSLNAPNIYDLSHLPTSTSWNSSGWDMANAFELVRTNISDNTPVPPWSSQDRFFLPVQLDAAGSQSLPSTSNISTIAIGASLQCTSAGQIQGNNNLIFGLNVTGSDPSAFKLAKYPDPGSGLKHMPNPLEGEDGSFGDIIEPYEECFVDYGQEMSAGPATIFLSFTAANDNATNCNLYLSVLEHILQGSTLNQTKGSGSNQTQGSASNQTLYGIFCWPQAQLHNASVIVDENNFVRGYELRSPLDQSTSLFNDAQEHVQHFMLMLLTATSLYISTGYHGARIGRYDWPGILTARIRGLAHPDGAQNADILAAAANQTFAQTFASFWALYSDQFLIRAPSSSVSNGTISHQIARMVPSISAFAVALSLLLLYFLAATVVYFKRRKQVAPRVPYSIGTILPWIIYSRMLKDFVGTAHLSSSLRNDYLRSLRKDYQFGWFRDEEGAIRLGLEESRYVITGWDVGDRMPHEEELQSRNARP